MFQITTSDGATRTVESMIKEFPGLFAVDESGWEVDPQSMIDSPAAVADAGYSSRDARRILFWACEEDSENDDGHRSIAEARWVE